MCSRATPGEKKMGVESLLLTKETGKDFEEGAKFRSRFLDDSVPRRSFRTHMHANVHIYIYQHTCLQMDTSDIWIVI